MSERFFFMTTLPQTQHAVQLVGPNQLTLNRSKAVPKPGPHEMLLKVQAVGLCFSDLKLLKQFDQHARKSEVVSGIDPEILQGMQCYVPDNQPVVPGHEVVCEIVATGDQVQHHQTGERCLVQTDYRQLPTAASCAAFGYNFEGGLQEYVLVDERVVMDPAGERFLIPVSAEKSASAVALIEPWACVEHSYVNRERQTIKAEGKLLVVRNSAAQAKGLQSAFAPEGPPGDIQYITPAEAAQVANESFDDIVYYGSDRATIEILNDKLAPRGLINIVLAGQPIGEKVDLGVGRIHYGMTRWIGTTGATAADSYKTIPALDEIRSGDRVLVIGAGGPMGQMHVIRNICSEIQGISLVGTDFDDARLASIENKARPLAEANGVSLRLVNPQNTIIEETFSYFAIMAPLPSLVESSIQAATDSAIINIFAGIPAPTKHKIDLDRYIEKQCFMFGTSGSVIEDMKIVLTKVESGKLDTNCSVDAISGMAGAAAGIAAVENRTLAGKILVYPMLYDVGLIPLVEMKQHFPTVAAQLDQKGWCRDAERELLKVAAP